MINNGSPNFLFKNLGFGVSDCLIVTY